MNFQCCDFKIGVGFKVLGVGWNFWTEVEGEVLALALGQLFYAPVQVYLNLKFPADTHSGCPQFRTNFDSVQHRGILHSLNTNLLAMGHAVMAFSKACAQTLT